MKPPLWRLFTFHTAQYVLGFCITSGLVCLLIPLYIWLFSHQLKWMPFYLWLGYTLLGIPIGIMAAGIMTLQEWTQRTDASIVKKIVVSVLVFSLLAVGSVAAAKGIRLLLCQSHDCSW